MGERTTPGQDESHPPEATQRRTAAADSALTNTPIDERGGSRDRAVSEGRKGAHLDDADTDAHRFIDALRALETTGDLDRIASLFASDAEVSNPTDPAPHHGVEGARAFWAAYRAAFRHVESKFRSVARRDDTAFLEWRSVGETAAGTSFAYDGVSVLEYGDDGTIRRFRAYFDPSKLTARTVAR